MSDSINNIETTTTTTKTVNNSKLIEEIKSNLNEQKQNEEEETFESKPMSSLSTNNKRSYLEINETVNKYKPFMLKQLETKKLKPSETLSRVRDFLPLLKESTSKLLDAFKENPDELNIENVQEDEEHIEMNLAVVSESEDSDDESDQEDEDETDTDDETEESNESNPLEQIDLDIKVTDKTKMNKIKLTKNKKVNKPMIKIVDDIDQQQNDDDSDDEYNNVASSYYNTKLKLFNNTEINTKLLRFRINNN